MFLPSFNFFPSDKIFEETLVKEAASGEAEDEDVFCWCHQSFGDEITK